MIVGKWSSLELMCSGRWSVLPILCVLLGRKQGNVGLCIVANQHSDSHIVLSLVPKHLRVPGSKAALNYYSHV